MTIWRMWIVGQLEATLAASLLLAVAVLFRHRLAPGVRSAILLIALIRLALPPFLRSPWSEAAADAPLIDDVRVLIAGALQSDLAMAVAALTTTVSIALLVRLGVAFLRAERASDGPGIQILFSESNEGPIATGLFRRKVIIPRSMLALDKAALDAAIAHEVAHHERRDLWWMAGASLLTAIAWFNPLAHVVARALVASREDGADDWAVARTSKDPVSYAQALLQSARLMSAQQPAAAAAAHPMGGRLRRLLDTRARRDSRFGVAAIVAIAIAAALALPGAHMPSLSDGITRTVIVIRR
jgi:hypothetical protein